MTLDECRAHIGHGVVYRPPDCGGPEDGVITSVGDRYVFVRYTSQHPGAHGQATPPEFLSLAH
jgi:hypothetical protein